MTKRKPHNRKIDTKAQKNPRNGASGGQSQMIFGVHSVKAALANPERKLLSLWLSDNIAAEIQAILRPNHPRPQICNIKEMGRLVPRDSVHQGIIAEVAPLEAPDFTDILPTGRLLVALDQINDPANMGAIIRSAAAFGAGGVIVPRRNSPQNAASLAKAASGALEQIPLIEVANLSRALKEAQKQGYITVGLDEAAPITLEQVPTDRPILFVMGAESKGLRRLTLENCDYAARLPLTGDFATLNVSAATAITLYILSRK